MIVYEQFPEYPDPLDNVPCVTCPTCRGTGCIDKSDGMVTFTNVTDTRLTPKRTLLWAFLGIVLVIGSSIVVSFIIYPRPLVFFANPEAPVLLRPVWVEIQPNNVTFLTRYNWILKNNNFFTVELKTFTTQLSWAFMSYDITPYTFVNKTSLLVKSKSTLKITQEFRINFSGDLGWISEYCVRGYGILTGFQAIADVDVRGSESPNIFQNFQYISCKPNDNLHEDSIAL